MIEKLFLTCLFTFLKYLLYQLNLYLLLDLYLLETSTAASAQQSITRSNFGNFLNLL